MIVRGRLQGLVGVLTRRLFAQPGFQVASLHQTVPRLSENQTPDHMNYRFQTTLEIQNPLSWLWNNMEVAKVKAIDKEFDMAQFKYGAAMAVVESLKMGLEKKFVELSAFVGPAAYAKTREMFDISDDQKFDTSMYKGPLSVNDIIKMKPYAFSVSSHGSELHASFQFQCDGSYRGYNNESIVIFRLLPTFSRRYKNSEPEGGWEFSDVEFCLFTARPLMGGSSNS